MSKPHSRQTQSICLLLALALWILLFRPPCPSYALFGIQCAGCGGTRMMVALLHLDFSAAFSYNPYLMLVSPLLLFLWVDEKISPSKRQRFRQIVYVFLLISAVCYSVWRNLTL